ncbi:hypothetical protein GUITHDRAFT_121802 [Guillardia theta CCMP2712]|uniref:Uncharacterized protein n=1 Tax=Guillardia theta (strain CCMP2712) TaxID=905079 RepID=L1I851_GUITC|nr:hypothetical protein GUITHDRAFT_121802 [Guillardia theta CCMP2712]EKX32035.1 hypothetical protein GUITHDRAFT_121802 [Guillardia theta CCMP2712]|eukprot:XP_005819015.1 hypothetical protein GUITHDRAFT_121802 [Guillardia theta CCMP2712]
MANNKEAQEHGPDKSGSPPRRSKEVKSTAKSMPNGSNAGGFHPRSTVVLPSTRRAWQGNCSSISSCPIAAAAIAEKELVRNAWCPLTRVHPQMPTSLMCVRCMDDMGVEKDEDGEATVDYCGERVCLLIEPAGEVGEVPGQ